MYRVADLSFVEKVHNIRKRLLEKTDLDDTEDITYLYDQLNNKNSEECRNIYLNWLDDLFSYNEEAEDLETDVFESLNGNDYDYIELQVLSNIMYQYGYTVEEFEKAISVLKDDATEETLLIEMKKAKYIVAA
ncbi:MAG TPA: hypothetical protein DEP72_03820 [Clostridiales bacterium]|nr:MAG: hypothetical protein A2Y18_05250 [Clostridiales bacterium GWD2_32_19]HCC07282.1 hypothetical protein [Clostridiales bacterium]